MQAEARRRPLTTLVLNADCRPLRTWPPNIVSVQQAVKKLLSDRVSVIETWDEMFSSPSITMKAPKVVMCRHYAPIHGAPKFCRRSIFLRDRFRCQYCGNRFSASELTFDHYVPRSKGGRTVWSNILSACVGCNALNKDGNHLRPLSLPRQPTTAELLRAGLEFLSPEVREDFGSWLYWEQELQA